MRSLPGVLFALALALAAVLLPLRVPAVPLTVSASDARLATQGERLLLGGEPFTGLVAGSDGEEGQRSEIPYRDGYKDGLAFTWSRTGTLVEVRGYQRNKRQGAYRAYGENGQLLAQAYVVGGVYQGSYRTWYEDGTPREDKTYIRGEEAYRQRMWASDGRLVADYLVVGGNRYGRVPTRLCFTVQGGHS